jgi:hypothetical protein
MNLRCLRDGVDLMLERITYSSQKQTYVYFANIQIYYASNTLEHEMVEVTFYPAHVTSYPGFMRGTERSSSNWINISSAVLG